MATYEEIYGKRVEVLDADPTLNSTYEGQVWFNSVSGKLKTVITTAAWSSAAAMIRSPGTGGTGVAGTATATVAFGGQAGPPSYPVLNSTEEFNGTGWATSGDMPAGLAGWPGGIGIQTAALAAGGMTTPGAMAAEAYEYDGSSWTATNDIPTARYDAGGAGTQTAGIVIAGRTGASGASANTAAVEDYNGSSWTSGNAMPAATDQFTGAGTATAAIQAGGDLTNAPAGINTCSEYDGSGWTALPNLNTAGRSTGNSGVTTSALCYGGQSRTTATESFDGTSWTTSPASLANGRLDAPTNSNVASNNASALAVGYPPYNTNCEKYDLSINTITAGAWASAAAMNTPRKALGGAFGTTTAGLVAGGNSAPNEGIADSEEFDGTSWTEGPNMNYGRGWLACCGTQTAALGSGGYDQPQQDGDNKTEEYDGSTWTNGGALSQEMYGGGGFGSQTAGVKAGGYNNSLPPGNVTTQTEEYNGSSWTTNPNAMGTGRYAMTGSGPATAGLVAGGYQYSPPSGQTTKTEQFDGTNWTTGGAMNLSRKGLSSSGNSQTACLVFGGNASNAVAPVTYSGYTEAYDGTAWSTRPSMATGRDGVGGSYAGTTSAAWVAGGYLGPPGQTNAVEEFTGETETVTAKTLTTG